MSSLFDRMFGRKNEGSSSKAKDRLQFVLVHDRINLPPERMQEMKEEILAVISKYVTVDRNSVDIALEQRDRNNSKLVAEIPVGQRRGHTSVIEPGHDNSDLDAGESGSDERTKSDSSTPSFATTKDADSADTTTATIEGEESSTIISADDERADDDSTDDDSTDDDSADDDSADDESAVDERADEESAKDEDSKK